MTLGAINLLCFIGGCAVMLFVLWVAHWIVSCSSPAHPPDLCDPEPPELYHPPTHPPTVRQEETVDES